MEAPFKSAYSIVVVLLWLCIVYCQKITDDETIGRACRFQRNDTSGVCSKLSDCTQVYTELAELNIQPTTCWFENDAPVVCCLFALGRRDALQLNRRSNDKCSAVYSKPAKINYDDLIYNPIVVGGEKARRGEFPHMVAIGWTDAASKEIEYNCGGTLISEEYVLTAAHCITSRRGRPDVVRIGAANLSGDQPHIPDDFEIANITIHPAYRKSKYYNDIALLRLNGSITISQWIRPACLWQTEAINATEAIVTGYGHTQSGGKPSARLLKADLTLIENSVCSAGYTGESHLAEGILPGQICAGDETGERDTCQGDSGGPLQIHTWVNSQRYYWDLIGITSFGRGCATTQAGVYTRVSYYLDWIESVVWP